MNITQVTVYPTDPAQFFEVPRELTLRPGDFIIFQNSELAEEAGKVNRVDMDADPAALSPEAQVSLGLKLPILRIATEHDRQRIDANEKLIDSAMTECEHFITQHSLGMRLVTAHFSFGGRQVMFVFTAESRVDFRGLVKDLAHHFKRKVRLKQIGPRDRARYVGQKYGAYGRCGRPLCCASFLRDLDSVTMDMVRVQNMAHKGAAKLSGVCGKLMHCLAYEVPLYQELKKDLPEVGKRVKTEKGSGTVASYDILSQMVTVSFDDMTMQSVHLKDLTVVSNT